MLPGRKTYIVSGLLIAYEVLGYMVGVKDSLDCRVILEALGLSALRAGIAKGGK